MNDRSRYILKLSRDMLAMGRVVAPKLFTQPSCDFHRELARDVMDPSIKRMNRIAPRGFAKSTVVAEMGSLWHVFLEDYFHRRERTPKFVLLVSKTLKEAKRRLVTIKEILNGPRFEQLFGLWGEETSKQWTTEQVILKDGSIIVAVGTGQQVRGMKHFATRPTWIVLDDPEDEKNTKTEQAMEDNLDWVLQGLEPALADEGKLMVIGTPQHQRSMVMVLDDMDGWDSKLYQATREVTGPDGKPRTVSLWPENPHKTIQWLEEKRLSLKSIGRERIFHREYMCQIVSDSNIFKSHYFKYWDGYLEPEKTGSTYRHWLHVTHRGKGNAGESLPLDEKEVVPVYVTTGVDPASSTARTASHSAIVTIATTPDDDIYVLPYTFERVLPYDLTHKIYQTYQKWRPLSTRVESVGYQTLIRDVLLRSSEFPDRIPGMEIKELPVVKGQGMQSKEDRLEGMQGLFAEGKVHIQPGMQDFYSEFVHYPDAAHRDLADAFYYAQRARWKPSHRAESYAEKDAPREGASRYRRDPMVV